MARSPKHDLVLDTIGAVGSGMYIGSIKGRLAGIGITMPELDAILRDLVADGLVVRKGEKPPHLWKRVPDS